MLGRVFKAYDIRGTYPDPLTDQMAWQIGFGTSKFLRAACAAATFITRAPAAARTPIV